jgi:hypothetical protein
MSDKDKMAKYRTEIQQVSTTFYCLFLSLQFLQSSWSLARRVRKEKGYE